MKYFFSLLLLLLGVASVAGQGNVEPRLVKHEDAKQLVRQLLNSPEKKDQAWAAWLAGKYGLEEFAPALTELLPAQTPAGLSEDHWLTRAIFDALIQLKVHVSAARIMPLSELFTDEVIILMANGSTKYQQDLLAILDKKLGDEQWLAVCNLLVELRHPGLAMSLLRDLHIQASIYVLENENAGWGIGGGAGNGGRGCGVTQMPKGFPPPVFYELDTWPRHGNILLARGRHPVYYLRTESKPNANGQYGIGRSYHEGNRNEYRVDYLLDLLSATREMRNFHHRPSFAIVWKNALAYHREVARIRKQLSQSWYVVVERLIQAGLLTADEAATLKPNISLKVYDHREDQTIKLPDF